MTHDPLLQYEQVDHTHTHIVRKRSKTYRVFKFSALYIIMTTCVFSVFMGVLNFSAYSAIIGSSIAVHAADMTDSQNSLQTVTEQISMTDPEVIYSRSYKSDRLLSGISRSSAASFNVTPYENRIIIPKLGKNIPLVDVNHDVNAKYGEMHNIFMEELKK